jgi:hypothetical protein
MANINEQKLANLVLAELDKLETHLAGNMSIEQMQSPLGYGLTMLLSTARRDPNGFYYQARQIRDLLSSVLAGIENEIANNS